MATQTNWDQIFATRAWPAFQQYFGESVTYTVVSTATDTVLTAIREDMPDDGELIWQRWYVRFTDATEPARQDQITDGDGSVWTVREISALLGDRYVLDCAILQTRG